MAEETVGTISRTLHLVRLLAEASGDVTVKQVSDGLGLSPSTAHRLLGILVAEGLAERAPQRRYRIGLELFRIAALVSDKADLARLAMPFLQEVVTELDETCLLGVYRPHDRTMMFAARVDSRQPLRYRIELHTPIAVAWGASGKSMLAFMEPAEVDAVLNAAGAAPASGSTLPSREEYDRQLAAIRGAGYAISRHEKYPTAVGIAAPVFRAGDAVAGCISITIPEMRYEAGRESEYADAVVSAAQRLSKVIGRRT